MATEFFGMQVKQRDVFVFILGVCFGVLIMPMMPFIIIGAIVFAFIRFYPQKKKVERKKKK